MFENQNENANTIPAPTQLGWVGPMFSNQNAHAGPLPATTMACQVGPCLGTNARASNLGHHRGRAPEGSRWSRV